MENSSENKKKGCRLGCLGLVIVGGLLIAGMATLLVFSVSAFFEGFRESFGEARRGVFTNRSNVRGIDEQPNLTEVWSSGDGATRVARIRLRGFITLDDTGLLSDDGSSVAALRAIKCATIDDSVRAIILDINSGGGGITASDVIFKALTDFKAHSPGRVVVAQFGDMAASGAYYIALAADKIVAHPTTITGSIGVIMQSYNIRELASRLGIAAVTIKSGDNKDILNPFSELTPQQEAMLQGVVDAMHERFVTLVAQHRGLDMDEAHAIADGRIFLAAQALAAGLIDKIGYAADTEQVTAELLHEESLHIIRYEEPMGIFDLLRSRPKFGLSLNQLFNQSQTRLLFGGDL